MSVIYDSSGNLMISSDGSIIQIGDASEGLTVQVTKIEMNGSDLLTEASLGSQFSWYAGFLTVDASSPSPSSGASYEYVDGSLATRDTLISQNTSDIEDVSIRIPSDFYSQSYVDASLDAKADLSAIPSDFYSQSYVDASLDAKADISSFREGTPATSSDIGEQGQFQYDASYLYICTSTNTWVRILGEIF